MFRYEYIVKEVTRVVDGDTVDIVLDLGFGLTMSQRCRIAGIDTPEKRTRDPIEKQYGLAATEYAKRWFKENEGKIIVRTKVEGASGKYGRLLGWFFNDETEVCYNELIIADKLAWEYDGGTKRKDFSTLELPDWFEA